MTSHSLRLAACLIAVAAPALPAQQIAPLDPKEFAARSITRLALLDLRANTRPTDDDYRIASHLLTIAHDFTPSDAEILRCRLEAAYACGDDEKVLELTRNLLTADPRDTVAQLRLITASIARNNQNAEDRIKAYERFLDPAGPGKAIDPSVLSRLALDESLLLRERGDDAGFIHKLTQATQLDSTHKEAAQLAATVYAERKPDDRAGCLRMMENVLMADPVDGNIHLAIAHELVAGWAFKAAERFMDNAHEIFSAGGVSTDKLQIEAYVLRWRTHGPADVVAQLNRDLAVARDAAERQIKQLLDKKLPIEKATKPEDVRLPPPLRFLYLMALHSAGETQALQQAVTDLSADITKSMVQLRQSLDKGEVNQEQMSRGIVDLASQLHTARLWTGQDIEAVRKDLAGNDAFEKVSPELAAVLDGWLSIRSGELAAGRARLEPIVQTAPLALLGIGLSYELDGQKELALAAYLRAAREHPLEVIGAWAASRAAALGHKADPTAVAALEEVVNQIPVFIDRLVERPQDFQQLRVEAIAQRPDAIDRVTVRLSIQNLSRIPFAFGPDRSMSSRLLIAPKLEAGGLVAPGLIQPEVVDLDRRLRLMPQEKLEIELWPDAGQTGWLMESVATRTVRIRWRVIQGFQIAQGGGFAPGVMGLTADTESLVRRPLAEVSLPPEVLAARVATEPVSVLPRLAAAVRASVLQPLFAPGPAPQPAGAGAAAVPEPQGVGDAVVKAFAARYLTLPPMDRAMLAAVLPHARLSPAMAPVDQVMLAETDPVPLCVVLATRVIDPADPLLIKCNESEDPRVKDMAQLVRRRLEGGAKTFAKFVAADIRPPEKQPEPAENKPPESKPGDPAPGGASK